MATTPRVKDMDIPSKSTSASTFTYGLGNPAVTQITKPGQTLPTTQATTTAKAPTPVVPSMSGVARGEYTTPEISTGVSGVSVKN